MISSGKIHITPRRGDYCLLDKTTGSHVNHTIFPLPGKYGKGILVSPTSRGNLLLGPTAIDAADPEATNTTADGLAQVLENAGRYVKEIPYKNVITSFAGLRAHEDGHEFIIGEVPGAELSLIHILQLVYIPGAVNPDHLVQHQLQIVQAGFQIIVCIFNGHLHGRYHLLE